MKFLSLYHKVRSYETRSTYTARKQRRNLLKIKTMNLVKTLASLSKSYHVFLANDVQLHDEDLFCCKQNGILSLDTTFNICTNSITDSCYRNQRLQNIDGQHPVFLDPSLIHFQRDAFIFSRFATEMCSF